MNTRRPAVAGRFYPSDAETLEKDISNYFKSAASKPNQRPAALIVPHAGYVFSGPVAAEAFGTIPHDTKYKRIFIIGSSHTLHFDGASIHSGEYYRTPLGDIPVDESVAAGLKMEPLFNYFPQAHQREHSLEVQVPFIQHLWGDSTPIIPILLGDVSKNEISEIAANLSPYFN
ncbi:MAG TPA: AmmeMemoRadiSam system protein B, partial [Bacteroidales bacterium]|nr:AmmeMemoRadiSam system protein B [Bacteroidales bacterium]